MLRYFAAAILFLLPLYFLRLPVGQAGLPLGWLGRPFAISFVEIAVYILFLFWLFTNPREKLSEARRFLLQNRLFSGGVLFLFAGLFFALFNSADVWASLGIIRGWFFAPLLLFFVLRSYRSLRYSRSPTSIVSKSDFGSGALALSAVWLAAVSLVMGILGLGLDWRGHLQGFLSSPNYLAMYLAPLLPLTFYLYRSGVRPHYGWLAGVILVAAVVFWTFSQGAWLGIAAAAIAAIGLMSRIGLIRLIRPIGLIAAAAIAAAAISWGWAWEALQTRLGVWEAAVKIGLEHPFLGIGAGMFQQAYQYWQLAISYPIPIETALHPHNLFLTFWLYGGALGVFGFLGILVWALKKIPPLLTKERGLGGEVALAIAASLIIILVHGLVDTTYFKNDLAFMFWALLALL